ncbi:uncharacterized protein A4U43_C08F580 [Asparagus officinalis]|nr:uncharacterized protein A4U43_C08F580 [Asparagus officinalis]
MFDEALDVVCDKMGVQSDVDEEGFNNAVLRKGCEELGYHVSRVPCNAPADHYCGWCHLGGCKNGKKQSTQETWLRDLADSGNGLILPGLRVVKIVKDRYNVARGVVAESICNNKQFVIESKVTVIACGALNTPGLLKRSGLKNKNIGKNLHLHPAVMAWGYFPAKSANSWPEDAKKSYEGGILTSMSAEVANFDTSGYGAIIQTPALHPGMFSQLTPWTSADEFRERMLKFPRTAHIFALARDKGTGTVDYPWTVTHRLEREDEENLVRGLEVILKVLVAAGAEEVGTLHCRAEKSSGEGGRQGGSRA